jgi:16S rRNA (guanine(1405)-N(7))-methyltransferase
VSEIRLDDVLARVAVSRRYRHVSDEVVRRLATEEIVKSHNLADAEKRTKRRLHQIFGAYTGQPDYPQRLLALARAIDGGDAESVREVCRLAMAGHVSTRERLPILDRFYADLLAITGVPSVVCDIACGLNPLAVPWMGLPAGARYVACDIDSQLVGFVAAALDLFGIDAQVELRDVVTLPPACDADIALLLKSVPCLDQQGAGVAARALAGLRARHIVVSFPVQSIGGREKGMERTYRARFATLIDELGWQERRVQELSISGELVFVIEGER